MATTAELRITLQPDGKVTVAGPINNQLLCYGLLEGARDAIKEFNQQKPSIVVAQLADVPAGRG